MTENQAREAIRNKTPVMIKTLSGRIMKFKRILCLLPTDKTDKLPTAVVEDKHGKGTTFCNLRMLQVSASED